MDHLEDQAQAAKVKVFWNETGKYLLLAVIVGLMLSFVWKYWKHRQVIQEQQASALYMTVVNHEKGKSTLNEHVLNVLVNQHPKSIYSVMAQLDAAGFSVKKGRYKKAEISYQWVIDHAKAPAYQALASCRLARLLLAQNHPKKALAVLDLVSDKAFVAQISILRARAYGQLGRKVEAEKERAKAKRGFGGRVPAWLI